MDADFLISPSPARSRASFAEDSDVTPPSSSWPPARSSSSAFLSPSPSPPLPSDSVSESTDDSYLDDSNLGRAKRIKLADFCEDEDSFDDEDRGCEVDDGYECDDECNDAEMDSPISRSSVSPPPCSFSDVSSEVSESNLRHDQERKRVSTGFAAWSASSSSGSDSDEDNGSADMDGLEKKRPSSDLDSSSPDLTAAAPNRFVVEQRQPHQTAFPSLPSFSSLANELGGPPPVRRRQRTVAVDRQIPFPVVTCSAENFHTDPKGTDHQDWQPTFPYHHDYSRQQQQRGSAADKMGEWGGSANFGKGQHRPSVARALFIAAPLNQNSQQQQHYQKQLQQQQQQHHHRHHPHHHHQRREESFFDAVPVALDAAAYAGVRRDAWVPNSPPSEAVPSTSDDSRRCVHRDLARRQGNPYWDHDLIKNAFAAPHKPIQHTEYVHQRQHNHHSCNRPNVTGTSNHHAPAFSTTTSAAPSWQHSSAQAPQQHCESIRPFPALSAFTRRILADANPPAAPTPPQLQQHHHHHHRHRELSQLQQHHHHHHRHRELSQLQPHSTHNRAHPSSQTNPKKLTIDERKAAISLALDLAQSRLDEIQHLDRIRSEREQHAWSDIQIFLAQRQAQVHGHQQDHHHGAHHHQQQHQHQHHHRQARPYTPQNSTPAVRATPHIHHPSPYPYHQQHPQPPAPHQPHHPHHSAVIHLPVIPTPPPVSLPSMVIPPSLQDHDTPRPPQSQPPSRPHHHHQRRHPRQRQSSLQRYILCRVMPVPNSKPEDENQRQ